MGRVMTCVLGMVVRREREIREFVKTPFYVSWGNLNWQAPALKENGGRWKAAGISSRLFCIKKTGFKKEKDARQLLDILGANPPLTAVAEKIEKKKENKNPPLLFNLAELQNECSRFFKLSPDETLRIVQELYEKKLVTYPRTDARVLSTAVAKEISKNIRGLRNYEHAADLQERSWRQGSYKNIGKDTIYQ